LIFAIFFETESINAKGEPAARPARSIDRRRPRSGGIFFEQLPLVNFSTKKR